MNDAGAGPWSSTKAVQVYQDSGGGGCANPPFCEDPESNPPDEPEEW